MEIKKLPCKLNISINRKNKHYVNSLVESEKLLDEINKLKDNIIKIKLELLFNYISDDEMVTKFNKIKSDLTNKINLYEMISSHILKEQGDLEKKDEIKELEKQISELKNSIKVLGKQYKEDEEEDKTKIIREIIEIYINELEPKLKEIMEKKYIESFIQYNENYYTLFQNRYNLNTLEINLKDK